MEIVELTRKKGTVISGPMSPMMAGETMAQIIELPLREVYRINFEDERVWNSWDPEPQLTGYDHLIVVLSRGKTICSISLVDEGVGLMGVGMMFETDDEMTMTEAYKENKSKYVKLPEENQIKDLMLLTIKIRQQRIAELIAEFDKKNELYAVNFNEKNFKRFKKSFAKACTDKQTSFAFENQIYDTMYAKYLIEFLTPKFELK